MILMLVRSINLNVDHQSELQLEMTHQSSNHSRRYKSVLKRDEEAEDYGRRRNRSRSPNRRRRRSRSRSKSDIRRRRSSRSKSRSYSRSFKRRHRERSRSDSRSDRKRRHRSRTPPIVKNSSPVRKNEILKSLPDEKLTKSKSIDHCNHQHNETKVQSRLPDEIKKIDNTAITSNQGSPTETNDLVIENVKLPDYPKKNSKESRVVGAYYDLDVDEPIDKERIHREIEEKLRFELAKEGKVYPPPKPEASHPVFANDGSFLEIFKKMQEQNNQMKFTTQIDDQSFPTTTVSSSVQYARTSNTTPASVPLPVLGRRRGGKILKTGIVAKPKALTENENGDPKDFWSIYLREVNKYKNAACETDGQTRPLVK